MNNLSLPHAESWGRRFDGSFATAKARGKNVCGRENPRKSKLFQPPKPRVFAAKRDVPRKPKPGRRTASRPPSRRSQTDSIQMHSGLIEERVEGNREDRLP